MLIIILLIIIIIACLAYLGRFVFKRLPDLKNLDLESMIKEKQIKIKARILQDKLSHQGEKVKEKLTKLLSPQKRFFAKQVKKIKDKVVDLENKYQLDKRGKDKSVPKSIDELLSAAENLIAQEEFGGAEKNLIEVIAKDKKNIKAYELLGGLYFENKNYDQAEEIFQHLLKLNTLKDRAWGKSGTMAVKKGQLEEAEMDFLNSLNVNTRVTSYYDRLAQICELTSNDDKALDYYLKANSIEPNNPKYLDKIIEYGIKAGDKMLAKRTLNHLKKINPENAKLGELQEAIEKMP